MAQTKTSNRGNSSSKSSGARSKSASRNGSSRGTSSRAGTTSRNGSGSSRSTRTASKAGSKASSTAKKGSSRARSAGNSAKDTAKSAKDTVSDGAQNAVESVGEVVDKVKMPLVAGGAALAGLAGAAVVAAVSRSGRRKKVLGVKLPKQGGLSLPKPSVSFGKRNGFKGDTHRIASAVTDAAKRADKFGQNVSKVATSVQNVSETADQAIKKA